MNFRQLYRIVKKNLGKDVAKYFITASIEQLFSAVCLNIVIAYATQYTIKAVAKMDISYLYYAIYILAIAMAVAIIVIPVTSYLSNKVAKRMLTRKKQQFYTHMMLLTKEKSEEFHMGTLMALFTDDIKQIEELYTVKIKNLLSVCFIGPISITALLSMNKILGLLVVLLGGMSILFTYFSGKKNKKMSEELQVSNSEASNKLMDLLNGLEEGKILGISSLLQEKYSKACLAVERFTRKRGVIGAVILFFSGTMYYLKSIIVLGVGLLLMRRGILSMDEIIASAYLLTSAGYMFDNIGIFYADVQKTIVSIERFENFIQTEEEVIEISIPVESTEWVQSEKGNVIQFKDVEFTYNQKDKVLDGISFEIKEGDYIAIVGLSGSGKSTIVKLLLGFYRIDSGKILIKGKDLERISVQQLRSMSSYVPQEPYLFPGTIKENIQYGNKEASMEEIIQAAKDSLCHEFIMELSEEYQTVIGNQIGLSGGQMQRIGIARALLKKAPILLLDEPTAALDAESEKQVLETLNKLKGKITILVITHKSYTLSVCDKVLMIDKGKMMSNEKAD